MSSIQRWPWISHSPNHSGENCKILPFYYGNSYTYLLKPSHIRSGTCYNRSNPVPSRTRWALSNGDLGFLIAQTIREKIAKYCRNSCTYLLKPSHIRSGTYYNRSNPVPSRTRWALSNSDLGFLIAQTIPEKIAKYCLFTMEIVVPTYYNLTYSFRNVLQPFQPGSK